MNIKSEKGAITLIALVTMLFLMSFLMSMYIRISNKAQSSAEATKEIAAKYARAGQDVIVADAGQVIPIKTVEDLKLICSDETRMIDGVVYKFAPDAYYAIQNDLDLECDSENQWEPLPIVQEEFTGVLDGLGHKISNLYIDGNDDYQGLFGRSEGTVKNLIIDGGHVKGRNCVGSIAGMNYGTIINCKNTANIIGNTMVTGGYFTSISTNQIIDVWRTNNVLSENAKFISESDVAIIPKGFKISAKTDEQTISNGLVIQDEQENEFVWIPVSAATTSAFDAIRTDTSKIEPYTETNYTEEQTEYEAMRASIISAGGFYIGRYETGIPTTENPRIYTLDGTEQTLGTSTIVVKRDCYPYCEVLWGSSMTTVNDNDVSMTVYGPPTLVHFGEGAVKLSRKMYPSTNNNYGVVSTLCYGVQWDAMLNFIGKTSETDSTSWGNYSNNLLEITRQTARYRIITIGSPWKLISEEPNKKRERISSESLLITTGGNDGFNQKNIFDIAGNSEEWTMEASSSGGRILRGGTCITYGSSNPVSSRKSANPTNNNRNTSFRITLYIK